MAISIRACKSLICNDEVRKMFVEQIHSLISLVVLTPDSAVRFEQAEYLVRKLRQIDRIRARILQQHRQVTR